MSSHIQSHPVTSSHIQSHPVGAIVGNDFTVLGLEDYLKNLARKGGPVLEDFVAVTGAFQRLGLAVKNGEINQPEARRIIESLGDVSTDQTMQGFCLTKPRGYAGDFEVIERIYSNWISPRPDLAKWDVYFHAQAAPRAVRNRKKYFMAWVKEHETQFGDNPCRILNVGSGPSRDIYEFFLENPKSKVVFDCVDNDSNAIKHASELCGRFKEQINFINANVLLFSPRESYSAIWSAGLFDYLRDSTFVSLLRKLTRFLAPSGEIAIGNFAEGNPTRPYMEAMEWFLHHRSKESLITLARKAAGENANVEVRQEPEGVNLFLHVRNAR